MKPPPRLLDDPGVAPELRADLKRVGSAPIAYDTAAGLAGFQAVIAESIGSASGGAGGHAAAQGKLAAAASHAAATTKTVGLLGSAGAKIALAAFGTAAVVAASVAGWPAQHAAPSQTQHGATALSDARPAARSRPQPVSAPSAAPSSRPQPVSAPSAAEPFAAAMPELATVEEPTGLHALAQAPTHRPLRAHPVLEASAAPTHADADESLRREIAQLAQIKAVIDKDPAQAYRLAQAGHREFGRGMLREEREGLAVLSLWQLGRRAEATDRARAFLLRYPQSPLRESIERTLQPGTE